MAFQYTFGSLKTMVKTILDRQDITDDLLKFGVYTAFQRIQRVARLPSMEVTETFIQPVRDWIPVFDNMVEVKHLIGPNGVLERKSLDYISTLPAQVGEPKYFCRSDEIWQLWPTPEAELELTMIYYAEFDQMLLDSETNNTIIIAFDVLLYGALSVLGELYVDERVPQWEQRFQQEVGELVNQAMEQEMSGSEVVVMAPEGSAY
jgi:hypothetical protein